MWVVRNDHLPSSKQYKSINMSMYLINVVALVTILVNTVILVGVWRHQRRQK
jgi:cytochrome c-type biogenesis protein CcmH/NrfG